MKTIAAATLLAVIVAVTGAVSASANPYAGLPAWAQQAFAPSSN